MKVVLLGPANVVHTQRWAEALASRKVQVTLVSQHPTGGWTPPPDISLRLLSREGPLGYFSNVRAFRKVLAEVLPDVVNAHYASGYGTTAAIAGYKPTVLSVWGSDVFDFPYQSWAAARLIRWNLRRADRIASTSHVMAEQVRRLVPEIGSIDVTPFGVECNRFLPALEPDAGNHPITIGTVKTLAEKYGVDVLIDAFARLMRDPDPRLDVVRGRLNLLLVGDGPDRAKLEAQVDTLGIRARTSFVGKVAHADVPKWLGRLDVYVAASRLDSESFGVAVIEASSCELPVVVSDAGGLPEVVQDGITGIVVPRDDSESLALALKRLVTDEALRLRMGQAGRALVQREYEWERCIDRMMECYESVIRAHSARRGVAVGG